MANRPPRCSRNTATDVSDSGRPKFVPAVANLGAPYGTARFPSNRLCAVLGRANLARHVAGHAAIKIADEAVWPFAAGVCWTALVVSTTERKTSSNWTHISIATGRHTGTAKLCRTVIPKFSNKR